MAVVGTDLLMVEREGALYQAPVSDLGGVPIGGSTGQLLAKTSGTDYAMGWGVAITVSTTAPASPSVNDIWVDTN